MGYLSDLASDQQYQIEKANTVIRLIEVNFNLALKTILESKKFNIKDDFSLYNNLNQVTKAINEYRKFQNDNTRDWWTLHPEIDVW